MESTPRRRVERAVALVGGKPLAQINEVRRCTHPGCQTRLSRYNPNPTCATHGGWADDDTRRNRDIL